MLKSVFLIGSLLLLLVGCTDSDDGATDPPDADQDPPSVITDLTVRRLTGSLLSAGEPTALLTWTAPADAENAVNRYEIRRSTSELTTEAWTALWSDSLTALPVPEPPRAPGSTESWPLPDVDSTATYFCVRSVDEAGNISSLSNIAQLPRLIESPPDTLSPHVVADLVVTRGDGGEVRVSFTAPEDRGGGAVVAYELRYSEQELNEDSWSEASLLATTLPLQPGSTESYVYRGLTSETEFDFAVRSLDGVGNRSPLSNVVSLEALDTKDTIPPKPIDDLRVTANGQTSVLLAWTAPGDDWDQGRAASYDLRRSLDPLTPENFEQGTPVDPGAPGVSGTEEALQVTGLEEFVDYYFAVRARDEQSNVASISNVVRATPGDRVPPADVIDLEVTGVGTGRISLNWTAPGNNGNEGRATAYELRYADFPLTDSSFPSAARAETSRPSPAGSSETVDVQGLNDATTYFVALRTFDGSGNVSGLSNVVEARTLDDDQPPAAVTDLRGFQVGEESFSLVWTAPGDDGLDGQASRYELRWSEAPLTEQNFQDAVPIEDVGEPAPAGVVENHLFTPETSVSMVYVALRSFDNANNGSPLSNNAALSRSTGDLIPPQPIKDLRSTEATHNSVVLSWTAPGDDWDAGTAAHYDLRVSNEVISVETFEDASRLDVPPPQTAGTTESFRVTDLNETTTYYFAVKSLDDAGNVSWISNVIHRSTGTDRTPPADVVDLIATEVTGSSVSLEWTAPGDDGTEGAAAEYDVRYDTKPIDESTFPSAPRAVIGTPGPAGSREREAVTGLDARTTYYFALKTEDDRGNRSEISNLAEATTLDDVTRPGTVFDLDGFRSGPNTYTLSWTAPGDDASEGTVSRYDLRWSETRIDPSNFQEATVVAKAVPPLPAGSRQEAEFHAVPDGDEIFVALLAYDEVDNVSALSNVLRIEVSGSRTLVISATGNGDYPTIQDGLDAAKVGDVVELLDGVYSGPGNWNVSLDKSITIRSRSDVPERCIVDGAESHWLLRIESSVGQGSRIEGITFRNADGEFGAAVTVTGADPLIRNCHFALNRSRKAKDIYMEMSGGRIEDCLFEAGRMSSEEIIGGGAIVLEQSEAVLVRSTFDRTIADWAAGVLVNESSLDITDCTFSRVTIEQFARGICILGSNASVRIDNSVFERSNSTDGGVIRLQNSDLWVSDSEFREMTAISDAGGVIDGVDTDMHFERTLVWTGSSARAPAFTMDGGQLTAEFCTIVAGNPRRVLSWTNGAARFDNCIIATLNDDASARCSNVEMHNSFVSIPGGRLDCLLDLIGQNGNRTGFPRFCDPAEEDFRLRQDSPCVSSGVVHCGSEPIGCGAGGIKGRSADPERSN